MAFAQAAVLCKKFVRKPSRKFDDTNLLPNAGESTSFAAFVYWVNDPVNPGITANLKYKHSREIITPSTQGTHRFVVRINQDNLIVFVYTVLIYPVGVEDS